MLISLSFLPLCTCFFTHRPSAVREAALSFTGQICNVLPTLITFTGLKPLPCQFGRISLHPDILIFGLSQPPQHGNACVQNRATAVNSEVDPGLRDKLEAAPHMQGPWGAAGEAQMRGSQPSPGGEASPESEGCREVGQVNRAERVLPAAGRSLLSLSVRPQIHKASDLLGQ